MRHCGDCRFIDADDHEYPWYCLKIDIAKCFYCVSHAKALDMFRSITEAMIRNAIDAEHARNQLKSLREANNEDSSAEAVDAAFERCKVLAAHSKYTVAQIIDDVGSIVRSTGDNTDETLEKMEARTIEPLKALEK